ncbi:MAG: hypothetical protein HUK21_01095 [Fibrobacteraceae bacterium]|nr:hypothetical protein [Fibrobacteraceae bacterium]
MKKMTLSAIILGFAISEANSSDILSEISSIKNSNDDTISVSKMEIKISGKAELDAYTSDVYSSEDLQHEYYTTADLNFDVTFNKKWSAFLALEADAAAESATVGYNGAWVKYQPTKIFSVKLGDLTFNEGEFIAYYGYDDSGKFAAGMKGHDIRGMEFTLAGLELGIGFGRGSNDHEKGAYNAHLAYELEYGDQYIRPYVDYKSYQSKNHNELHTGVENNLNLGAFSLRTVYGFHADYLNDEDTTSNAHVILLEPIFEMGWLKIKTSAMYAYLSNGKGSGTEKVIDKYGEPYTVEQNERNEVASEIPEYFFAYVEPQIKLVKFITAGIPVEYHTNSLDSGAKISTVDTGLRLYISPIKNLNVMTTGMFDIPVDEDNKTDDISLYFGLESVFTF